MEKVRRRLLLCATELVIWIDIDSDTALPEPIKVAELERLLMDGELQPTDDPFLDFTLREVEDDSVARQKRDAAWDMLEDVVQNPGLFERRSRGLIVNCIVEQHGVTKQTVYRLLRRYWQRGMCKNALLPDYENSGGRGKRRKPKQAKLGRPRVVRDGRGTNITPDIERIFHRVIEERLLKERHPSIPDAYSSSLNLLAVARPDLSTNDLPTLEQFRYFYNREYHFTETVPARMSAVDYAKDIRPLKSTSTTEALGPGYRYQIDATIADIYLVSEHDRSLIVGRPVVYMVIDVFSRMVVGMYVGFEGPSWVSAMVALANTVADKVEYCRQYDVDIDAKNWPVKGLPDVVLADKGELNGTKVEAFSQAFGVRIENAPARRGDAKGIVERYFRTVQEHFKPYVSGVVEDSISRKRGGHDYRLDATLTLTEFTQTIIAGVLWHNNFHTLSKYDRTTGMPADLPAIPVRLWGWGLANLTGRLRSAPQDLVRINLLPHEQATVSDLGIRLFGCFYTCQEALKAGWFHRGQGRRPDKVTVAYDPRSADHIFIRPSNSLKEYWVCDLADRSRRFKGMTFWDVWVLTKAERRSDANASMEAMVERGKLLEQIESIAAQAEEASPVKTGITKKDLGTQIRENKQQEKRHERRQTAFRPEKEQQDKPAEVVSLNGEKQDDYAFPDLSDVIFGEGDDD
ncbi:MAG: Mu transposase C-terminal domain-containing protein [Candidatus Thiodiazotropha endolucinida]|nr:Mu transposase C-terminal domain-containing protein [Candidatus Thiodiazotropha taylori]MCW4250160.1 Mu transposase C-terminal domain-containing protein [Candidatus Thiodiazotropha endolucinida]MCG7883545.1 Mu transposase C-terminal domain-containing protein [Candidatus Thiodiazotropha taylori]MCG8058720.1 Mu transposase C-terminal domain-containing protein [Candidatus Thiodiazotropha taylori]MCG8104611.1 Mu transposase C-terminal domain-containing protein [Candidatus Thiodiazotropha taylori